MTAQQAFIDRVRKGAIRGWLKYGVLPSLSIAQAILESGWGGSALATQGNALFGIKATPGWHGRVWTGRTVEEYSPGTYTAISAGFRAYNSWDESIEDHGKFLRENSRYHNLLGQKDYRLVCNLIRQDGYATASNYTGQLIGLIEQYHLTDIDRQAFNGGDPDISGSYTVEEIIKVDNSMSFIFNVKNDPENFNPGTLYYYNGRINKVQGLHNQEELKYLQATYEESTALSLPSYNWDAKIAPVYMRLFGVLKPFAEDTEIKKALWQLERATENYLKAYGKPTHFIAQMQLAIREEPKKQSPIIASTAVGTKYKVLDTITQCDFHWAKIEVDTADGKKEGWFTMGTIIGDWYGEQLREY